MQRKVVEDQQIRRQEATEDAFVGVVGARLAELFQECIGAGKYDAVTSAYGGSAERLDQKALAHTHGSDQDDVFPALQELEREDVLQLMPIEVHRRAPVEVIQRDALLEAGLDEMLFEGLLLTSLDLVGEQQRQERGVVEVLRARQRESLRQR